MIHIFRVFENDSGDFLEFVDKQAVVEAYLAQRNPLQYDWQTMRVTDALKSEQRLAQSQSLRVMQKRGDQAVVMAITEGQVEWYSPTADNGSGIPSEYSIAIQFFTDPAKYFRVTSRHHEVFEVARDPRFRTLSQKVINSVLRRVEKTQCEKRLDKYLDMNLRKLKNYGIETSRFEGSYFHIKDAVQSEGISCPFFSEFFTQLMDICIKKEHQLVGENRVYEKTI